jgi:hypothetical protein
MVLKCSEYSWTTAAGVDVSNPAVLDSPFSDSDSIRSWDMKVVDLSAPSHWGSDYSTLEVSLACFNKEDLAGALGTSNNKNVASETESWDSHATYRSHKRRHFR